MEPDLNQRCLRAAEIAKELQQNPLLCIEIGNMLGPEESINIFARKYLQELNAEYEDKMEKLVDEHGAEIGDLEDKIYTLRKFSDKVIKEKEEKIGSLEEDIQKLKDQISFLLNARP